MKKNNRTIHVYKSIPELITALADYVAATISHAISEHGECNLVLSGGSSPKKLYEALASIDYKNRIAWRKVNFFFGDERYVPVDDPDNNSHMARTTLLNGLHVPESNIFSVDTSLLPEEAAMDYSSRIVSHFKGREIIFDLILLGLGDNSHTASLFPHTAVLHDTSATIRSVFLKEENTHRITMTAPLINQAQNIAFLVYGKSKAEAVYHVLEGEYNPEQYPAQLIQSAHNSLHWYLDEEAASLLKDERKT
jgi:6-phosphogluconolactonase